MKLEGTRLKLVFNRVLKLERTQEGSHVACPRPLNDLVAPIRPVTMAKMMAWFDGKRFTPPETSSTQSSTTGEDDQERTDSDHAAALYRYRSNRQELSNKKDRISARDIVRLELRHNGACPDSARIAFAIFARPIVEREVQRFYHLTTI
eukprot:6480759-Pyramimonas_sp.AAC.1